MPVNMTMDEAEKLIQENAELHKVLDALLGNQDLSTGISWLATINNYLNQYTKFHHALFTNIIKALKNYEAWERINR